MTEAAAMPNRLANLFARAQARRRKVGGRRFVLDAIEIGLLSMVSFLLAPLKRRAADEPFYRVFDRFLADIPRHPDARVLEIGSRNVSGVVRRGLVAAPIRYTGFDVHAGENVDVVGDAHALGRHFPAGHFDAVFSVSVFEHLAMPWQVLLEINRVLKPGGLLYISTHPVWPAHELPWDFWRFSAETFEVLLNRATGFKIVECVAGNPARLLSLARDPATRGAAWTTVNQSIAVYAVKTGEPEAGLAWNIPIAALLRTRYPLAGMADTAGATSGAGSTETSGTP